MLKYSEITVWNIVPEFPLNKNLTLKPKSERQIFEAVNQNDVCRILGILFEAKIRISFPSFINLGNGTYFWPWIFFTLAFWRLRSYLKWSPITFGPLTFLVPKKFGPWEVWAQRNLLPAWNSLYSIFMQGPTFLGPKFLRDQISWRPNFSGTKFLGDQKSQGPKWDRGPFQL